MDRLRRSLRESFRRKKDHVPECSKPHQWQSDEAAVRSGTCNFLVKYLGCVEVFESRGMQVCEEALKVLRNSRRRPTRGTLYVTGDGLRVVDDETKGLIVDQTIEKVSFCAPDRNHEKGFSYICRDGTTRRWMCHGFLALKDSGERLSHAVGCAFAVCLERKQKRDKETVMMNFDPKTNSFTRTGSFRQSSLTERMQDPQEYPPPVKPVHNPYAIERPHATPMMLQRQGSFRGFSTLNQTSPFKRQLSLRVNDLPSNMERQRSHSLESSDLYSRPNGPSVTPIPESSPVTEKQDTISAMCQQLSQGLNLLASNDDPFMTDDGVTSQPTNPPQQQQAIPLGPPPSAGLKDDSWSQQEAEPKADGWLASSTTAAPITRHPHEVIRQSHQMPPSPPVTQNSSSNPTTQQQPVSMAIIPAPSQPTVPPRHSSPNFSHLRSQSLGSSKAFAMPLPPPPPTVALPASGKGMYSLATTNHQSSSPSPLHGQTVWANGNTYQPPQTYNDPFDAEWVALAKRQQPNTNPFTQNSVKAFEVHM